MAGLMVQHNIVVNRTPTGEQHVVVNDRTWRLDSSTPLPRDVVGNVAIEQWLPGQYYLTCDCEGAYRVH